MIKSLWISKTGLDAQQTNLDTISNNLANVSTNGFKRSRAVFEDLLYQNMKQAGSASSQSTQVPTGVNIGTGVRTVSTERIHNQGNLLNTSNSYDMAIQGAGFFPVLMPDGRTAYTRDGSFHSDAQGNMVTSSGYPIQPSIQVPAGAQGLSIGSDGSVSYIPQSSSTPQPLGRIQLASFSNPAGLQAIGQNLLTESGSSGAPVLSDAGMNGNGTLMQGYVETSNVNVVEELVSMIQVQRAYEMNSKAITTSDQMMQKLSQL